MTELLFIHWNPDLVFFHLGPFAVRWYGLCWLLGFVAAYLLVRRLYREQHIKEEFRLSPSSSTVSSAS